MFFVREKTTKLMESHGKRWKAMQKSNLEALLMDYSSPFGTSGSLLTVDVAVAQIIRNMDAIDGVGGFIIKNIDPTHILVKTAAVEWLKESVANFLEANVWTKEYKNTLLRVVRALNLLLLSSPSHFRSLFVCLYSMLVF